MTVNVPAGLTITGTTSDRGSGCGPLTGGVLICSLDFLAERCREDQDAITIGATIAQSGEQSVTASADVQGRGPQRGGQHDRAQGEHTGRSWRRTAASARGGPRHRQASD